MELTALTDQVLGAVEGAAERHAGRPVLDEPSADVPAIVRRQVDLIYELGVARGRGDVLGTELLLGILLEASGAGPLGLLIHRGDQVSVKRADEAALRRVVTRFVARVQRWTAGGDPPIRVWARRASGRSDA